MSKIRPIRVEIWRKGEHIDESPADANGMLERPLEAEPGDALYMIWEWSEPMSVVRPITIKRVT